MVIYNQDKQNLALTYFNRKPLFFISMKHAAEKEREFTILLQNNNAYMHNY